MDNEHTPNPARGRLSGLNMEIVIALLISLVAVAAIVGARKFPATGLSTDIGSARFPTIYALALIVLCAILVLQNLRKHRSEQHAQSSVVEVNPDADADAETPSYLRPLAGVAATVAYLVAMPFMGYALTTGLFLSLLMALMGLRHKAWNPLLALAITAAMVATFALGLNVPLPVGSWFE